MTARNKVKGKENIDMCTLERKGSLARMFQEANSLISSKRSEELCHTCCRSLDPEPYSLEQKPCRSENLFQELDSRELTKDEQAIIDKRVRTAQYHF